MPTYDYRCEKCDQVFEEFHGMTEEPDVKCPACGGNAKKMVGGGLGIIFKGSGFYVTDSKSASKSSTSVGNTSSDGKSSPEAGKKDSTSAKASPSKKEPAKTAAS